MNENATLFSLRQVIEAHPDLFEALRRASDVEAAMAVMVDASRRSGLGFDTDAMRAQLEASRSTDRDLSDTELDAVAGGNDFGKAVATFFLWFFTSDPCR